MSALGRQLPVEVIAAFSTWQPAMLGRTAGFGQERTHPKLGKRERSHEKTRHQCFDIAQFYDQ